jgi:hypothetical protein
MPLPVALGLFSGEFATLRTSATLDGQTGPVVDSKTRNVEAAACRFADRVSGERTVGDYFLKISEGGIEE